MDRVSSGIRKKIVLSLVEENAAITKANEVCLHRMMIVVNTGFNSPSTIREWKFLESPLGFSLL